MLVPKRNVSHPALCGRLIWKRLLKKLISFFLEWVLKKKGFGSKWISWMMGCVKYSWFSIMLNFTSKDFFCASRGLRQCDPLSPFLFSLVANSLSSIRSHVVHVNLIDAFKIPSSDLSISHLQFVDDTIVFVNPSTTDIMNLKYICLF